MIEVLKTGTASIHLVGCVKVVLTLSITNVFQVFLKVTDIAAQEETDSLADSQREDGEDETANDETANDELPEHHVTNGTAVNTEVPGVEMMDIAGHDEGNDDDPLLEPNQRDCGECFGIVWDHFLTCFFLILCIIFHLL